MKKIIILLFATVITYSCQKDANIEQFMVNRQENSQVTSFDITPEMLQFKEGIISPENKELLQTVRKANIMFYKTDTLNKDTYTKDIQILKNIFKNKKYQEIARFGKGTNAIKIYSVGKDVEHLNEVIIVGNDDTKGWGLARITGKNMNPQQLLTLIDDIDWTQKNLNTSVIESFFK